MKIAGRNINNFRYLRTSLLAQMVKCLPTIWEARVQSLGQEDLLEKEMATHSSTLAWKNPWREEPRRLQLIGSRRVGYNWATELNRTELMAWTVLLPPNSYVKFYQVPQTMTAFGDSAFKNRSFPGGSDGKESFCNVGHLGLIPGSGRSPGEGNGNPFQYSCLENPTESGAWWAKVHRVAKSQTLLSS